MRKNPLGISESPSALFSKMDDLTKSINRLISILESADRSLLEDFRKSNPTEKLSDVLDQNQKIAQGIVALADMLKKMQAAPQEKPRPAPSFSPASQFPGPGGMQRPTAPDFARQPLQQSQEQSLFPSSQGMQPPLPPLGLGAQPDFPPRPPLPGLNLNPSFIAQEQPSSQQFRQQVQQQSQPGRQNFSSPSELPPLPSWPPMNQEMPPPLSSSTNLPPPPRKGFFGKFKK